MEEQKRAKAAADLQKMYDKFMTKGFEPIHLESLSPAAHVGRELALAPLPASGVPSPGSAAAPARTSTPAAADSNPSSMIPGPVLHNREEFSQLLRAAGYQVHDQDPGALPYFDAITPSDAADLNLPLRNGLQLYYYLEGGHLVFAADLRPLRPSEIGALQADSSRTADPPQTFLQKLNNGIPFFLTAGYFATPLPVRVNGSVVQRQELLLLVPMENKEVSPDAVKGVATQFVLALTPNKELWQ